MAADQINITKFINNLKKYEITYKGIDKVTGSVMFSKKGHEDWRCAGKLFFRYSGKCIKVTDSIKNYIIISPLTDDDFYKEVLIWVLMHFKVETI